MLLNSGTLIGPYQVIAQLGVGGMGEVYRAMDTRLGREVALKVLPASFMHDAERVARFRREAQILASLNHPQIGGIHGLEDADGFAALVLELVEGPTLADRIAQGAIPLDESLAVAKQIAEALDAAHERGVIHRDLKPANIKLRPDGIVKVLDFGLAKAVDPYPAPVGPSTSPTIATPVMTQAGMILGTAAYMSPEQARGRIVDKRADIWAFGCVLHEMLTGRRSFEGESVADVLAAVLTREPDVTRLPASVPGHVAALIRRCLQKDPRQRLRDIGDAIAELAAASEPAVSAQTSRNWRALPWALAIAAGFLAVASMVVLRRAPSMTTANLVQVETKVGQDVSVFTDQGPAVVLSPDGNSMAFTARKTGEVRQLYVRRLDRLDAVLLAGTEDALSPFFSPDGQWIAFFAGGKLKKIPAVGGAVVVLCDAPSGRGGSWSNEGWIVFTPNASGGTTLQRVSANGGPPEQFATLREGEAAQRWPQVLPDGRGVLYSTSLNLGSYNDGEIVVKPLPDGDLKVVLKGGFFGRYLRSGHLTFVHDGRLFAVPFDLKRLETVGAPVPVLPRISRTVSNGAVQFDVSETGTAAYIAVEAGLAQPLQWLTRDGAIVPLKAAPLDWSNPRFSPDGQRLTFDVFDGQQTDIWIYDWAREALRQLTFDPGEDWFPLWTPEGARITFRSNRRQFAFNLHWQRADGGGESEALSQSRHPLTPAAWHPRGDVLAFTENNPTTNYDIGLLPLDQKGGAAPGAPRPFLNTVAQETGPAFSPDGNWIAYVSNESGRNGVYVRPFPGPGGQWLVAPEGTDPVWSRTRPELVYLGPDQRVMTVAYKVEGDSFRAEPPTQWASARAVTRSRGLVGFSGRAFDLHPDGQRLIGSWTPESAPVPVDNTVILAFNFFEELRRLAPVKP